MSDFKPFVPPTATAGDALLVKQAENRLIEAALGVVHCRGGNGSSYGLSLALQALTVAGNGYYTVCHGNPPRMTQSK